MRFVVLLLWFFVAVASLPEFDEVSEELDTVSLLQTQLQTEERTIPELLVARELSRNTSARHGKQGLASARARPASQGNESLEVWALQLLGSPDKLTVPVVEEKHWRWLLYTAVPLALVQYLANVCLTKYAKACPDSRLNVVNEHGILRMPARCYVVSAFLQMIVFPACWVIYCLNRAPASSFTDWWFHGERQFTVAFTVGYTIAYYAQDTLYNIYANDALIVVHHVACILLAICCYATSGWRGLAFTTALFFESGSVVMGFVDLKLVPRFWGPVFMAFTTLCGMGLVFHACVVSRAPDLASWAMSMLIILAGLGRLWASYGYMQTGNDAEDHYHKADDVNKEVKQLSAKGVAREFNISKAVLLQSNLDN